MVTVIKFGKNLRSPFYYNEHKVKAGVAEVIHSMGYGKDTAQLSRKDRIARLEKQATLNDRVKLKSAHITVNFHPSEQLDKETLQQIVDSYMQRIGFGGQPYVVYQHKDAAHPHVHVMTTTIRPDGTRIPTYNIGRNLSEPARQAVEVEFGLVRATDHQLRQPWRIQPVEAQKVQYGRTGTRRGITIVLDSVLAKYRYTSIPELNAVLKLFNVAVDQGNEGSRLRQRGGLVYRVLSEDGTKVGVPIKASDLYSKPTLKYLQGQFARNSTLREGGKTRLQDTIDAIFSREPLVVIEGLQAALNRQHIQLVMRRNESGKIHGLTYIDHKTGAIFNGSDLGKEYSAGRVMERIGQQDILQLLRLPDTTHISKPTSPLEIMPVISTPVPEENNLTHEEQQKKRKRKRKRLHL